MIIYCTTVALTFKQVRRYAEITSLEIGSGSAELIVEPPHLTPRQQQAWADELWEREQAEPAYRYVVASTYEVPILRLMRRIREKYCEQSDTRYTAVPDMEARCLRIREPHEWLGVEGSARTGGATLKEKIDAFPLRVDHSGEFMDVWPDGFFSERMEELF